MIFYFYNDKDNDDDYNNDNNDTPWYCILSFRLYKSDKELTAQTAVRGGVTKVTATLTAAPEDNGARLRCEATNAALPTPLSALTTLSLLCKSLPC